MRGFRRDRDHPRVRGEQPTTGRPSSRSEADMADFLYIATGLAIFAVFGLYAGLLRRA